MVKSVRCLNGKMCPESFPAYLLDFEICFFVYLLDTYIFIQLHGYFCYLDQKMVKSAQFIKSTREIQTSPKNVLCIQGIFGLYSLVYSKYMLPPHEMDIFRYLDQNYGKKCPFCISEALFQF